MAKAKTTAAAPDADMAELLAASGAAVEATDATQEAPDTVESLTAANDAWAAYADELQKQLDAQTAIVQTLQAQLEEANAKKAEYEAKHGRATEGLKQAAQGVHTAAVAMAGVYPHDTAAIPTVEQINAAAK